LRHTFSMRGTFRKTNEQLEEERREREEAEAKRAQRRIEQRRAAAAERLRKNPNAYIVDHRGRPLIG